MAHLYDYAWAQIPAPAMAGVPGCVGAMRYINDTKALTPVERDNLHAAGLGIGPIYEAAATDLEHPERAAGIAHKANDLAHALGCPTDVPIQFCHDANDNASPIVRDSYQRIQAESLYPAGLYGSEDDLEAALPTYGWQVETWVDGHPKGSVSQYAHLVQLANTKQPEIPGIATSQYDTNILHRSFPLWTAGGSTPATAMKGSGMYFGYFTTDRVHAYAIDGGILVTELGGAPDAFGLPKDAVDLHVAQGIPLFPINPQVLADIETRTANTLKPPAGGGSVDVDALAKALASQLRGTL